jgi:unsaturated rhamnogalacturonyl hydrolase
MKQISKIILFSFLLLFVTAGNAGLYAQSVKVKSSQSWSQRISDSFMLRHPADVINDTVYNNKWTYDQGVFLEGLRQVYLKTGDKKYYNYIKTNIDQFIQPDGKIKTYKFSDFNIDNVNTGKSLLFLYNSTKDAKYKIAADTLRKQLASQPRTKSGGFWHKKIYPFQMWLDGLYMGEPFYAQYSKLFNSSKDFDDIALQFILIEKQTRDEKTGLLYHAWDESKQMKWADPVTGRAPNFWSRAMGWYAMALVDVLDFIPKNNPNRGEIIKIIQRLAEAVIKVQDEKTGIWYQIPNMPDRKGNYLEASASCMFTYALTKGVNKGYLDKKYIGACKKAFEGIIKNLVTVSKEGYVDLHQTCKSAGLGGTPYRDGSFEYYINEPKRTNDLKGVGPFIMAAVEIEKAKATK